jgi:chromosome segregation ATPase
VQRELADKDGEIRALQDRLSTARGSWDAEAQQTDARLNEKDLAIRDRDGQLRDKIRIIEERDDELADLQRRLRAAETERDGTASGRAQAARDLEQQLRDTNEKLQLLTTSTQAKLKEKDGLVQARETELQRLQSRMETVVSGNKSQILKQEALVQTLQTQLKTRDRELQDQSQQITSLKSRLGAMETPSKKDSLIRQQADQIRKLQQQMQKLELDKETELDDLDAQLHRTETENSNLKARLETLRERADAHDRDQGLIGRQDSELTTCRGQIRTLEGEIDQLRIRLREAVEQRQRDIKQLEQELTLLRSTGQGEAESARQQVASMQASLESKYSEAQQALEDEILVLETNLEDLQARNDGLQARVRELETEAQAARQSREFGTPVRERNELRLKLMAAESGRDARISQTQRLEAELNEAIAAKSNGTPVRERNDLRQKLRESERKLASLQDKVETLQSELEYLQQEKTIAAERSDLHELLKKSKIEAEQLQIELDRRDRIAAVQAKNGVRKDAGGIVQQQLDLALADVEDLQAQVTDLETRLRESLEKERKMRTQAKSLSDAQARLTDLESQVQDRTGSATGHARREAELRGQLRTVTADVERLQLDIAEKDGIIEAAGRKETELRARLQKVQSKVSSAAAADDTIRFEREDLLAQLDDADLELQALQAQLGEREARLSASLAREAELRGKLKTQRHSMNADAKSGEEVARQQQHISALEKRHEGELRGLVRQIQYLRARCTREEGFRADLSFVKNWFMLQVEMYSAW